MTPIPNRMHRSCQNEILALTIVVKLRDKVGTG
jgi:hypothetical protein